MSAITSTASVRPRLLAGVTLLACGALLGSCSDSSGTDDAGPPSGMQVLGGNGQEGTVGVELADALVVKVTDDRDRPVRNQLVNWRVTAGGGTVFAGSALTDPEGVARERWTLGTVAGAPQSVEARAVDNQSGQGIVFATFTAVARAGGPARLEIVSGNEHDGTVGEPLSEGLVVRAVDALGNGVPHVQVTWSVRSGGGTVSPTTSTTNEGGIAQTVWTLGTTAETQTAAASTDGVADAVFTARALAGLPYAIVMVSGDDQDVAVGQQLLDPLVVRVTDRYSNPTPGVSVSWAVSAGGGSVVPIDGSTDDDGRARARWTLGSIGDGNRVTATAVSGVVATSRATGLTGGGGRLETAGLTLLMSPPGTGADGVYSLHEARVRLLGVGGAPIANAEVTWSASGGGSITPLASRTDEAGYAKTSWRLGTTVGENTLTARTLDVEPVAFRIATKAGPVCSAYIRAEDGSSSVSGLVGELTDMPLYAFSEDQFGNPVGGYGVSPYPYPTNLGYSIEGSFSTDATGRSQPVYVRVGTAPSTQEFLYSGYLCQGGSFGLLTPRLQTYSFHVSAYPAPAEP